MRLNAPSMSTLETPATTAVSTARDPESDDQSLPTGRPSHSSR